MIDDIRSRNWDAIVIGTGIGGGTVGRRLAEMGWSVLFLEKGPQGGRSEGNALPHDDLTDPAARMRLGAWPDPVRAIVDGSERNFHAPLGAGVGGSSVFFAATLERPEPHDLDHSPERPHPTGGWPIGFAEMLPYFDRAQQIFAVNGEQDPLAQYPSPLLVPGPTISDGDARIMAQMRAAGLHPYQLHSALRRIQGCEECLGRKCPHPCKMDGRSAGVEPAVATGRAVVVDCCEVTEICGQPGAVSHVVALRDGQSLSFSARHIVLAAGALSSPRLLLASRADHWPDGIGNRNDQVGRNLMFHFNEMFAIWPPRRAAFSEAAKSVGFRDLYFAEGERFGMVQAMGLNVGEGEILHFLRLRLARSAARRIPGARQFARLPAMIAARTLGQAKVFVALLEDLPYADNRVTQDPMREGGILIQYKFAPELLNRRERFRKLVGKAMNNQRSFFLTYEPEPNFGHPCGSLRMGKDPEKSVLDENCRVHGMTNLWVTDASFMPTSMGVNPSLTIAANALRVAEKMEELS
ncbi:GMC family oxidoreductase [Paracoccus sp. MBLB3053]|uniref:GMC family oxidoreductase n=1 Tax=Paracoccus aurantius TaxID=3073814 RepID=A0ABU2HUL6_9RHOB|nr:GMC family oxidoreductase [Paracoccus sp. MBLB3053]MDS9468746.1 GMC family oxidoreductase [Paracoccus sp. MBLB3053]